MGVGEKLKNIGIYVRKRWRSTDPDSYDQYRRGRERTRKEEEHTREAAERQDKEQRKDAERGREYGQRYKVERAAEKKDQ